MNAGDTEIKDSYLTPDGTAEYKFTIKGSKFIGWCAPADNEQTAQQLIKERSRQHHSATHNCWAYRVGNPADPVERSSDEGEPSGTAGRPILEQIRKANLVDAVLVVSRWFGGTKLGKGGLIRAYGECAAETIKLLKTIERKPTAQIEIECGYELVGLVERIAARFGGYVCNRDFTDNARLQVKIPLEKTKEFRKALTEESAGRIEITGN